jgi:hypothetical protein
MDTNDDDLWDHPPHRQCQCKFCTKYFREELTWPNAVIGKKYKSWDGKIYLCDSYEWNMGFWMTDVSDPTNRRNVSERAIGRTFHAIREVIPK